MTKVMVVGERLTKMLTIATEAWMVIQFSDFGLKK